VTGSGVPFTITYDTNSSGAPSGSGNDACLHTVTPTTVYVDDTWTSTTVGTNPANNPVSGGLIFGYNAFANIQSGVDALPTTAQLPILGATNAARVNTSQTLQPIQTNPTPTVPAETPVTINGAVTLNSDISFSMPTFPPPASPVQAAANLVFGS